MGGVEGLGTDAARIIIVSGLVVKAFDASQCIVAGVVAGFVD